LHEIIDPGFLSPGREKAAQDGADDDVDDDVFGMTKRNCGGKNKFSNQQ